MADTTLAEREEVKVLTPEQTARALAGSGFLTVTYPEEIAEYPGVRLSFEIQRVVGADAIAWDAIPQLDDRGAEKPAAARAVWHPELPGKNADGPWSCPNEPDAQALAETLRAANSNVVVRVRRAPEEGSTDWIVSQHPFDPEVFRRYQHSRLAGGCRCPRLYFGNREATPAGWLHYRDVPDKVLTWLYDQIEALREGSRLNGGSGGRFPDAGLVDTSGSDSAAVSDEPADVSVSGP